MCDVIMFGEQGMLCPLFPDLGRATYGFKGTGEKIY